MATFYVNSNASDSNNGTSKALAKKTLSGVNAVASAGDTIMAHGRFLETIPVSKQLFWVADGRCQFNGNGGAHFNSAANTNFLGIDFTGFSDYITSGANGGNIFTNCCFHDVPIALEAGANGIVLATLRNCIFYNCSTSAINAAGNVSGAYYCFNCVFYGNAIDADLHNSTSTTRVFNSCLFGSPIQMKFGSSGNTIAGTDNNIYDFTGGKCVYNGVDKTSLSAWKTAVGSPIDANSIDRVWTGDVGDYANRVLRSNPSSYLLTAGPGASPIGLYIPGLTISNNANSSLWTGAVLNGCAIDGSGNIYLTGVSPTSGTAATDVIDLGANISVRSIELQGSGESTTSFFDTDTGDSPNYFNLEVRASAVSFLKTDVSPSWVTVPRQAELGAYMASSSLRYWQIRVTLRG